MKNRYGPTFYQSIGKKGGETVKRERGTEFYAEIGRKGGEMRGQRAASRRADSAATATTTATAPTARKRGRPAKKTE